MFVLIRRYRPDNYFEGQKHTNTTTKNQKQKKFYLLQCSAYQLSFGAFRRGRGLRHGPSSFDRLTPQNIARMQK